ncbi:DNA polymerase III subunit alpha [Sphingosinicella sp. BN140058]|uniref:DNA polymerase III subunit alpha n=1 Tax=Sphingosinicella sp. BN140058 TaxID=1892855 RepID=UPI001011C774|nr:DNA polymerase III subunit alpha [Sphingosinicella sp. BN140058]QAY80153.1 DNA polymerase III subunit alpha [Sphingosinicella sp. BN140058]
MTLPADALPAINLRGRSSYSIMQSALVAKKMPSYAVKESQPALGLIDHRSLAGALEFASAARKEGVQPIVGCDFDAEAGRITLIAETAQGWANLLALSRRQAASEALAIDDDDLEAHSEGLILLTGAPGSALLNMVDHDKSVANNWLKRMMPLFQDRLYLEISRTTGRRASEAVLDRISRAYSLPLVGTSPAAYGSPKDYELLELLRAIDHKKLIDDANLVRPENGQHFKSSAELVALFADAPQVLENAARLALRCSADAAPQSQKPMLPRFPDAQGREDEMLRQLAAAGYETRIANIPEEAKAEYRARLASELDIICKQGFAGYFLIVADFIGWSKRKGIPVGPGRGSGAGSAVAWAMGITDLDPIRWGLLFERFINPERVSLPDFDVDFCQSRRDETIQYVREKYGEDRVVAIGTHGSWKSRSAFGDAARCLGISAGATHAASQYLPGNAPYSLAETDPESPSYLSPEVRAFFKKDPNLDRALKLGEALQGFVRQHGRHAAGIIIADPVVGEVVPVMRDPGVGDDLVTQFDMKGVEDSGLVKFDFLGLKTSTIIKAAVEHVRASNAEHADLDILDIPFDDDGIFEMLNAGYCHGIFQLESEGMVKALKQVRPTCFEDLIAIISLYRPGPMDNIPTYAARKAGLEPLQLPHPALASLLSETQGIPVYQEQIMQMAQILAGYTLGGADMLRRAMGKKIQAEMDAQRETFIEGCIVSHVSVKTHDGKVLRIPSNRKLKRADGGDALTAQAAKDAGAAVIISIEPVTIVEIHEHRTLGISRERAIQFFDTIDKFAGYGFNKSHAAAYALLCWQSAWLKLHHPAAFYAAALTYNAEDFDKLRKLVREARERGIELLPPSLEKSGVAFQPDVTADGQPAVRWGLGAVKGLGGYAAPLSAATHGRGIKSIEDLAKALAPHGNASQQAKALAAAGVLDVFNKNRQAAAEHLVACLKFECGQSGQSLLFDLVAPACPKVDDLSRDEKRAAEIDAIGISFDEHPLANAWSDLRRHAGVALGKIDEFVGCGAITVLVRVESSSKSARGASTFAKISDASAEIECVIDQDFAATAAATLVDNGEIIVADIAKKPNEGRWRMVQAKPFRKAETPQRIRLDIKASHNWEDLRRVLTSAGRGQDRLDIMIDLGEKKARKVLPACFNLTPDVQAAIAQHPDVLEMKVL